MVKEIRDWVISLAIALVIVFLVHRFLVAQYTIDGASMEDTFHDSERVIVNKIIYNIKDIGHGDVVVFDMPSDEVFIKRIIGVPGDKIEMRDKVVYLNDEPLDEPYVKPYEESYRDNFTLKDFGVEGDTIPEGEYLVLGDNREVSKDSREIGLIDESDIIGKVQLKFWPFSKFTTDFSQ